MPDTARTLAALEVLLADNGIGGISAQDLRDAVVSLAPVWGECSLATPGPTSIGAASTFVALAGATVAGELRHFTHASPGRLTYDAGQPDRLVHVRAAVSFTHGDDAEELRFRLAVNGTTVAKSEVREHVVTGAEVRAVSLEALLVLSAGDFVEVYVSNESSDADPTAVACHLLALGGLR